MGISVVLDTPYYTGGATATGVVPSVYDVALNGRPFNVELDPQALGRFNMHYSRTSLPLVRDQADSADVPGEHSVSPEQFWRRSVESWHDGAGQTYYDRKTSDEFRFHTSKGVNPWTPWGLSLLNDTTKSRTTTNTGLLMCKAGTRIYLIDGATVYYSTDAATWTGTTGGPAAPVSLCTDGFTVYIAAGTNGIYSTNTGTGAQASFATGTVSVVGYAKGRLMAANGAAIYNVTAGGALPAALSTHRDSNWTWVGFAEGANHIYCAGFSGTHSEVYRIGIVDTGATLGPATLALTLPEGEVVRSITGYLGLVLIGTDKGIRLATSDSNGNLTAGQLIPTPNPVYCADGQDRFMWFGWTNYDATSSGLGRVDLSNTPVTPLTPAYASDLMATGQGAVRSTVQLGTARVFTVDGVGVFKETVGTAVASGTLTSGLIGYDLADPKIASFFDLRHDPLPSGATVAASVAYDNGAFTLAGTSKTAGATSAGAFFLNGQRAERFEVQLTLTSTGSAPNVTRMTLRVSPAPAMSSKWTVPLVITDEQLTRSGVKANGGARADYEALVDLFDSQIIFTYQEGNHSYLVRMADFDWLPNQRSVEVLGDWTGHFVATLQEITG
jgi:hypothetical protein